VKDPGYVGLFGSYGGTWRERAIAWFQARGIACKDPSDPAWDHISHENGDAKQAEIDALVARQHELMHGAACILFNLDAFGPDGKPLPANAARCELGFLTGAGIRTFVHIHPQTIGRNYLWAQLKPYPHIIHCATLESAMQQAAGWLGNTEADTKA